MDLPGQELKEIRGAYSFAFSTSHSHPVSTGWSPPHFDFRNRFNGLSCRQKIRNRWKRL